MGEGLVYGFLALDGGALDVMVIFIENGHDDPSSNLDEVVCISYCANIHWKGMNPIILPLATGK